MKNLPITFLILAFLCCTGCASIIHGPRQDLTVNSYPSGAEIYIDGLAFGETPKIISLRRKGHNRGDINKKKAYTVRVELPGYEPYEVIVSRKLDGWVFGNLVFGALIGLIIDATSGSMYRLSTDELTAQLQKEGLGQASLSEDGLHIFVTLEAKPEWEKVGQLVPEE